MISLGGVLCTADWGGGTTCKCPGTYEAKWKKMSDCVGGDVCKTRIGDFCAEDPYQNQGVWDGNEGKCVSCSGAVERYWSKCVNGWDTGGSGNWKCEYNCGADGACDEVKMSDPTYDECGWWWFIFGIPIPIIPTDTLQTNRFCDSNCVAQANTKYVCNQNTCGTTQTCDGRTWVCTYNSTYGGWRWLVPSFKLPDACCNNNDCAALGLPCDNDPNRYKSCENYRCTKCDPCFSTNNCMNNYCCPREIDAGSYVSSTNDFQCKPSKTIINWNGKSYLCGSSTATTTIPTTTTTTATTTIPTTTTTTATTTIPTTTTTSGTTTTVCAHPPCPI
jgi:hypothetical protein